MEKAVRATVNSRTSILIAHRLSTIEHADRVISLMIGEQSTQHIQHAVHRTGGLAIRATQVGHGMKCPIQVRRTINENERFAQEDKPVTQKIPKPHDSGVELQAYTAREAWHLFGIMSEFADATERTPSIARILSR